MRQKFTKIILFCVFSTLFLSLSGCGVVAIVGASAGGAAIIHDRRSTGALVDDQIIEVKARNSLRTDENLWSQSHINVTCFNNITLLSGETPNDFLRDRAAEIVKQVPVVKKVHNEIAVVAPSSALSRSSDTWITGKVKTSLIAKGEIDATRIKVVTERGIVYLMGLVTRQEADIATDIVRRVGGVQRVIKLFEYIQPSVD
uniref:Osmotically-inducible protein OsmY, contains BON domain n=1 Tax=Candidatus Kentrum sp. TUN TaxID=2126343 RepID=A0A450ZX53_9GAMM|nr:MAG: Osmotically-inducible protein OsmY, contains BON domain [Candidatus Kentron sp. TUN]VFK65692.1 MAG: Osmotically-inducible protein OsmY, contains BON domain [Candidatus Kentron sp. TUN]VFK67217.1 MAG: Osmotically-inducible protein OsmY, contains BON domain [Candidatus Kentron sp. TUN]